jgi:hypothetical protein
MGIGRPAGGAPMRDALGSDLILGLAPVAELIETVPPRRDRPCAAGDPGAAAVLEVGER